MKFYSDKKETLSVISKVTKKRIALFINGEFETDDLEVIERLKTKFRYEKDLKENPKKSPKVVSHLAAFQKLKKEAVEKGIYEKGMKKKDLEKALENLE